MEYFLKIITSVGTTVLSNKEIYISSFNVGLLFHFQLLVPLLKQASQSMWPKIVWSATHAPGLLKTPRVKSQSTESILKYNEKIRSILDVVGIPVFDTFKLTNGTVSFDGVHYGRGVNLAKAQIFLNYLLGEKYKESEK